MDLNTLNQTGNLELIARQMVEGFVTGLHKSPYHGFSVEFAEHRIYNSGEPTRHIDWKLFGRTDKLFTKRYEEETNLRCQLIVDNSSSMHYPDVDKKNPALQNKITVPFLLFLKVNRLPYLVLLLQENLLIIMRDRVQLQFYYWTSILNILPSYLKK